ncbi:MAG: endonuclease IV [Clostridiales bacterium]|nr:endonuclease IV [Clostridiales bacterium]
MIKFGPSGNSIAFSDAGNSKSEQSAVWVKNMGLSCFEYSFGRGVNLSDERAISIGKAFFDAGVEISVHAPYYINLANPELENAVKSFNYILQSAEKVKLMGGKRVVFHPASQGKMKREQAVSLTIERLKTLRDLIYGKGLDHLIYCPETMGKLGQIGTIEEVTEFCKIDKIYTPAVDFGHINAREFGSLKTEQDYLDRLNYMIDNLGYERMKNFHIHFSKIEYSAKGEVRHLTFEDNHYGPDYEPMLKAIKKLKLEPFIVCESAGTQDIDALKMQKTYYDN